ncbi:hypothetical protein Tco_0771486 [Tanacetum coccineum]|uniref:Uncharacterized protein n=1 Tax=Tanacetum coccineum TaxID=301880 RepID=A0ABQ4ZG45_9ASTR
MESECYLLNYLGTASPTGTNKGSNKECQAIKVTVPFLLVTLFNVLNVDSPIIKKAAMGSKILEGKLVLVDDDRKPLDKVDYPVNSDNNDEVEKLVRTIEGNNSG